MSKPFQLEEKDIAQNFKAFHEIVEQFSKHRKDALKVMYKDFEEELLVAPASSKSHYHNAFPGGYCDHVLRVIHFARKNWKFWTAMNIPVNCTIEEVVFAAMHHDLGKLGFVDSPNYVEQTDDWRKRKLNESYTYNENNQFMLIQDRSLFLLQQYGVTVSLVEYLGIKLHDGLYDETNKPYYVGNQQSSSLRTYLPAILHQADFMATKFEYERYKLSIDG